MRLSDLAGGLPAGAAFPAREPPPFVRQERPNVLIPGAADSGLAALVLAVLRPLGVRPVLPVVDRCATPLAQNRCLAEVLAARIDTMQADVADLPPGNHDARTLHNVLFFVPPDRRAGFLSGAAWTLRPVWDARSAASCRPFRSLTATMPRAGPCRRTTRAAIWPKPGFARLRSRRWTTGRRPRPARPPGGAGRHCARVSGQRSPGPRGQNGQKSGFGNGTTATRSRNIQLAAPTPTAAMPAVLQALTLPPRPTPSVNGASAGARPTSGTTGGSTASRTRAPNTDPDAEAVAAQAMAVRGRPARTLGWPSGIAAAAELVPGMLNRIAVIDPMKVAPPASAPNRSRTDTKSQ